MVGNFALLVNADAQLPDRYRDLADATLVATLADTRPTLTAAAYPREGGQPGSASWD